MENVLTMARKILRAANEVTMKKVLILDNDEGVLDVMYEALIYEGFDVKIIEQTDNIFPVIDEYAPDLVMLDYILSGVNGGEICHQIKTNPKTSSLPVILMSAYPRVLKSLGYYGCDDFISKPFDLYDLIDRVKKLIDRSMETSLHE